MKPSIPALVCAWLLAAATGDAQPAPPEAPNVVASARALAAGGNRGEAIRVLEAALVRNPEDGDVRVLLGLVLSWDRQYEAARVHLERVLAGDPTHGDALPALMNVETWSGHPDRAVALAAPVLESDNAGITVLHAAARAERMLGHPDAARRLVERASAVDPESEEVRALRMTLAGQPRWDVRAVASADWFSDDRDAWRESLAWVTHRTGRAMGTIVGRGSFASRFDTTDQQFEVDLYPRFSSGTYAYLNVGAATQGRLYPSYRIGAELNQRLPRAFEVSVGVRRLAFDRPVNLYVGALTKYLGSWMVTARVFHLPDDRSPTTSGQGIVRRYFGADGTSFVGVHYGRGRNLEDLRTIDQIALLDAQTGGVSIDALVTRRVRVMIGGEASLSDRPTGGSLSQYTVSAGLGWGF